MVYDSDEELEKKLHDLKILKDAGYNSMEHFLEFKRNSFEGMMRYGGKFLQSLAQTLYWADQNNSLKILRYWHQECEQHSILFKIYLAKKKAEEEE